MSFFEIINAPVFSSFLGGVIAVAVSRNDIKWIKEILDKLDKRITTLENIEIKNHN